jgi:hypothetical protein
VIVDGRFVRNNQTVANMNSHLFRKTNHARFLPALLAFVVGAGMAYGASKNNSLTSLTNLVVCPGARATFSTVASGQTPYRFQRDRNGTPIAGQTNNSLTLANVSAADAGTCSVTWAGGNNSATVSATLTVNTPVSAGQGVGVFGGVQFQDVGITRTAKAAARRGST